MIVIATYFNLLLVHHQSVLPKGRAFTASEGTMVAVLPKAGLPPQTQDTRLQFYQGWIDVSSSCFLHPTLSISIWTGLLRSEKIPGAPTWRSKEWILLTELSGLHRNSPQDWHISSIRVFDQIKILKSQSPFAPYC